jgi:hypothetical protein
MADADNMYAVLINLRGEATDAHKNLLSLQQAGTLTPDVVAAALIDQASLLADTTTNLANILAPDEAELADADDDDDEMEEVEAGLEPDEAALLRRLVTSYREMLKAMLTQMPEDAPQRGDMTRDVSDCERALGIVNDLELEEVEDDEEEATEEPS